MIYFIKNKAFSLIELLIVIAIIGLLASAVIVSMTRAHVRAQDARRLEDIASIKTALELYMVEHSRFPDTLSDLLGAPQHLMSAIPKDPTDQNDYEYAVSADKYDFVLKAKLRSKNRALDADYDNDLYGVACSGDDSALLGPYDYCVRP